ncbi:bifunctional 23S rRNA (guanine(2069)-N(7))-methyltransferase RlmK/23S rRNA (guanine(2445)-N(2))-methyltransferase RlmL [Marinomonas ostreistagni]|uniref:bifunctional 23S rRNA (guanine(2069)-N(7))-methyltransferase RlmK/23S rRNA (guanine(2445)-N(2))-methyltransferase RlmL n=1 Tax=Marinomonas ostreistagni TaxID=359209 RepID=UPI00194E137C|nr:bifunctional 23S rRNA (guanine(2069)-N(7))-methyltransferase RlmK/23S rRNA (guanine(2445)-N(2))-methyltransferase RlmL [Marinomonas ostreistagni]MBM6551946.1 bifunctional 23S rRNA (guanine(2069)-N(7))-methyltransferase RlmK/23S rRNA (guanine(2445)-N(2))-methyltransferase RlmL [Marinomonas ostreistagni]
MTHTDVTPSSDDSQSIALELTCPIGLENILEKELHELGLTQTRLGEAQVKLTTDLRGMYLACLWSRVATRIMMPLATFQVTTAEELYDGVASIDWSLHMHADNTIAIDCHGTNHAIRNTQFGAVKTKDAIVDYFTKQSGRRPSVEKQQPDLRIALKIKRDKATLSLDVSGESMHRRGYRQQGAMAPLKENLAAGLLLRAGWSKDSQYGQLVDPMCGSGTFLVEAALISLNIAPGSRRQYWGFKGWKQHDHRLWQQLNDVAKNERIAPEDLQVSFQGTDREQKAIAAARENIKRAGLVGIVQVEMSAFQQHTFDWQKQPTLVMVNPPYGERLGDEMALISLYRQLGDWAIEHALNGDMMLLTSSENLARQIPIRPEKSSRVLNGGLECRAYRFPIADSHIKAGTREQVGLSSGAQMVVNRLQKNMKKLRKWIEREQISCYRVYDADMPEYAVAIDIYNDWAHVQEYQAPKSVDENKAQQRLFEVVSAIPLALNIPETNVVVKQRLRQSGKQQYEKVDQSQHEMVVEEHGCDFIVNLKDYLDTGLFLDHRPVRKLIQQKANGTRFLNLFCYTASGSVHAGQGGAKTTLSVDMSNTYTEWARRNIELNEFSERDHQVVRADCFEWLRKSQDEFDLIFMDPPTFSNSKKMAGVLDIQRDHVELIDLAMARLSADGELIFSNNYRRFELDEALQARYEIENITRQSLGPDFERNQKIHQCWILRHK